MDTKPKLLTFPTAEERSAMEDEKQNAKRHIAHRRADKEEDAKQRAKAAKRLREMADEIETLYVGSHTHLAAVQAIAVFDVEGKREGTNSYCDVCETEHEDITCEHRGNSFFRSEMDGIHALSSLVESVVENASPHGVMALMEALKPILMPAAAIASLQSTLEKAGFDVDIAQIPVDAIDDSDMPEEVREAIKKKMAKRNDPTPASDNDDDPNKTVH